MNLTPHITVAIKRHAYDLEGIGETVLASALVSWVKLLPESVSLTNLVQSEPSPKPHNPDGLTPERVGVVDGWRLLDEDEIGGDKSVKELYCYSIHATTGWYDNCVGNLPHLTYRTKLSRADLATERKEEKRKNYLACLLT